MNRIYKPDLNLNNILAKKDEKMREKVLSLKESVNRWKQEVLNNYCPQCTQNCCSPSDGSRKQGIMLHLTYQELLAVTHVGPRRLDEMLRDSERHNILFTPDRRYVLCVNKCPSYDQDKHQCSIHHLPDKPLICDQYPFDIRVRGEKLELSAYFGCEGISKLHDEPSFMRIIEESGRLGIPAYREIPRGKKLISISF